jgi:hypothetical protein
MVTPIGKRINVMSRRLPTAVVTVLWVIMSSPALSGENKPAGASKATQSEADGPSQASPGNAAAETTASGHDGDAQDGASADADGPGAVKAEGADGQTAAQGKATMRQGTYSVRLRDLEDRINRLKEQIFRSKARLSLLAETVLDRKIAGSKAVILFRNEMGSSFRLVKVTFLLDGAPIYNKSDEAGNLAERDVINLFEGPVMPGEHTLSAVLHYRGHGYGIFSYLRGYSFKTRSSRTFTVQEGKSLKLEVIGYEKGGVTTSLEDRPDVRYVIGVAEYNPGSGNTKEEE